MPPAAGAAGSLRLGGSTGEPGCRQEATAGCVRLSGPQQHGGLQPQGVLCGRHAQCFPGRKVTYFCLFILFVALFGGVYITYWALRAKHNIRVM